jgi:hypothetical protein
MVRHSAVIVCVLAVVMTGCGGGGKTSNKPVAKPDKTKKKPPPPPETEEDRERKRHEAALEIVPSTSTCLPTALKDPNGPALQLAAIKGVAYVCAIDTDTTRLLGPIACWQVDLSDGSLTYTDVVQRVPGRGYEVKLDGQCARGFCLPKDAEIPGSGTAWITWSVDGSKVAVLAGEQVHEFDAKSQEHQSSFSIKGDKGVTNEPAGLAWVGNAIFVEGRDAGPYSAVWVFKADGKAEGPIESMGRDAKPISTYGGSLLLLDGGRVGVSEQGFTAVTTYEIDSGKRTKLVRKINNGPCKKDELEAYWKDSGEKVGGKCKDHLAKMFGHFVGADAVAATKSWVALLRGPRLGEIALLDPKTLTEKKAIKMPWCEGKEAMGGGSDKEMADDKADEGKMGGKDARAKKVDSAPAKGKGAPKNADPDDGGE